VGLNKIQLYFKLIIFSFALTLSLSGTVYAVDLTLSWDRPDDDRVTGYKVFYGEPGTDFQSDAKEIIASPHVTHLVIYGLDEGQPIGFTLKSVDSFGNESDFSDTLYHLATLDGDEPAGIKPEEIIIDNGDPGTSWEGSWRISAGTSTYGNTSEYSIDATAAYTFEKELSGTYDVSLWWTYYSTRCTRVAVDIYDGDYLAASLELDQQSDDGRWNSLGEYEFSGTARVVIHSSRHCTTNVDGIRFVSAPFPEAEM